MLFWTNPYGWARCWRAGVGGAAEHVVRGRVRKLSRASQDRVADSAPSRPRCSRHPRGVRATPPRRAKRPRFDTSTDNAFLTAVRLAKDRSVWPSSSSPPRPRCCGACTRAPGGAAGHHHRRAPGRDRVYVIIWPAPPRCWERSMATCCARPATERLIETAPRAPAIASPARRVSAPLTQGGSTIALEA